MLSPNCQCNYEFMGSWIKEENNRNVPCWRCVTCDAFAGKMDDREAKEFRRGYFATPKPKRQLYMRTYRYDRTVPNWHTLEKEAKVRKVKAKERRAQKPKPAQQMSLF